ncbi:MAG: ABC transporter permease [bacterium]|nr:ABC transporter permease [bacterium]
MKRFIARYSPLFILAGLCLVLAVVSSEFRSGENVSNVARRTCVVGIAATGQTLVILTGGIDLSVGSVAALSGCVATMLINAGLPVPLGILAGALIGLCCGSVSGLLWAKGKIPPFIATLGMMMAARGGVLLLTGSEAVYGLPESFRYLGGTRGWWIPVVITLAITAGIAVTLNFTRFGRSIYATGGNAIASRLSGVNVDRVRIGAFALCGLLVGFAGVMHMSKIGIGDPQEGVGMELDAIAACVIGGASLMGGEGGCVGALAGALIMNVLVNFCNLQKLDPHWQSVLVGSLIIVLVYYDNLRKRRAGLIQS